jgi:hypothetical protein
MSWPLVDRVSDRVLLVTQERPLVGLHRGLVDAFAAAARAGRGLQLVTPPGTRLTVPLRLALDGDGRWVVRAGGHDGGAYDGVSGAVLACRDGAFVPAGHGPGDATGGPRVAPAPAASAAPAARQLWLSVSLLHERPPAAFGLAAEAVLGALAGAPPAGWGIAEPVSEFWRPATLSRLVARRLPRPTTVTIVGAPGRPAVGTIEAAATPAGVAESLTLAIGLPGAAAVPPTPDVAALAGALAREHPLLTLLAVVRAGREDLTVPPLGDGPAAPLGLAVAGAALGGAGLDGALALPGAARLDAPGRPAVWYDLAAGPAEPWAALDLVAAHLSAAPPRPPA